VVKILDFGIARLGPGAEGLTRPGAVLGTPAFLAPEQRIGAPTDFRTDLYGLGATLFFLLTGQPPTAGRPLRDLRPDVPPGLADLVARLLAEEPARRPASVAAVAEALTAWTAPRPARRRWPAALGLAAAVALGLAILFRPGAPPAGTAAVAPSSAAAGPELRRDARRFATGHEGLIWACGLTPQGDLAVSAGGRIYLDGKWEGAPDFTPRVWAVATGREVRRLEGQVETVYTLAIAPDGRRVAAAGHDRAVRVWDLTTGELLGACLGHAAPVYQVAFAPDGRHLYSGGTDRTVRRWDAATFQEVDRLDCRGEVRSFALTPDGKDLIAGVNTDAGHALQWWTVSPAQQRHGDLPVRHTNEIRGVAVSPDGHWVLSGSTDTTIRLWDLAARAELRCLQGHGRLVKAVAFLPDGRHAVSASFDHTARLWDLTTGRECLRLEGTAKPVTCLAVARDGTAVLCGGFDKVLRLWPVPRWD
jgi:hypothetical protein